MPKASAAEAARTAATILDVAKALFAERGYAGVSLDDIATGAAVTRGAVYHHYANKIGLFRSVAASLQKAVAESVVQAAEEHDDATAQLRSGCHAFVDAITQGPTVRVLLVDAPAQVGWAEWRAMDAENSETHLREALAAVGVDPDIRDALTAQLSGAMNEASLWIARHPDATSRRAAHRALDSILDAVVP